MPLFVLQLRGGGVTKQECRARVSVRVRVRVRVRVG
jgi:hypothetical protein